MHNCLSIAHMHHLASWEKVCYLVLPSGVCPCSRDHMPFTTGDVIMGAPYVVMGDHKRPFIYVVSGNRILLWLATGGGGLSCSYEKSRNQSYEQWFKEFMLWLYLKTLNGAIFYGSSVPFHIRLESGYNMMRWLRECFPCMKRDASDQYLTEGYNAKNKPMKISYYIGRRQLRCRVIGRQEAKCLRIKIYQSQFAWLRSICLQALQQRMRV